MALLIVLIYVIQSKLLYCDKKTVINLSQEDPVIIIIMLFTIKCHHFKIKIPAMIRLC